MLACVSLMAPSTPSPPTWQWHVWPRLRLLAGMSRSAPRLPGETTVLYGTHGAHCKDSHCWPTTCPLVECYQPAYQFKFWERSKCTQHQGRLSHPVSTFIMTECQHRRVPRERAWGGIFRRFASHKNCFQRPQWSTGFLRVLFSSFFLHGHNTEALSDYYQTHESTPTEISTTTTRALSNIWVYGP